MSRKSVLVLGGGPDSEREVSLVSAKFIAAALDRSDRYRAERRTIDRITVDQLRDMPGDVIFPALHGGWGEGGPLQDLLEGDGRPFVASGSRAARWAMDKIAAKITAAGLGIPTPPAHLLDARDSVCPLPFPVIIKPVHEGSTVGLHVCPGADAWAAARKILDEEFMVGDRRCHMIEACVTAPGGGRARELTVGLLDGRALPIIEIRPADGLYDYEAKYTRNDTEYLLDPPLPPGVAERISRQTEDLARAMGIRHVARADFMLGRIPGAADGEETAWFLEINTLPGFTDHSLVPKAAHHAGLEMPELCARLVDMAIRDHAHG